MRTYQNSGNYGDVVRNASRQVWLASLGAAVVTREWAQAEAPRVIRSLVKEGTLVESRTMRVVGDRLEGTFTRANMIWQRASNQMKSTMRQAAGSAMTLVQSNLPNVKLPAMFAPAAKKAAPAAKRAAKNVRTTKPRKSKPVKTAKRATRTKARTSK